MSDDAARFPRRASLARRLQALAIDAAIVVGMSMASFELTVATIGPVLDPPWRTMEPVAVEREIAEREDLIEADGWRRESTIARETRRYGDGTLRVFWVVDGRLTPPDGEAEVMHQAILIGRDGFDAARMRWTQALLALIPIAYFAGFEASRAQATPGKQILALKVTDLGGQRLAWWHALARQIAKLGDVVAFGLGYFLIAASRQRQALHDILARTLVIDTRAS